MTEERTSPSYATSKQMTSPMVVPFSGITPGLWPLTKSFGISVANRFTSFWSQDRPGRYSPNGTGGCLTYIEPR